VPIYVLYSGRAIDAAAFTAAFDTLADDFHVSTAGGHPVWRWLNGDLVIADWYRSRGQQLAWDTLIVAQWDMLVLAPVDRLFASLKRDEILLSGTRSIAEVEQWWSWVKPSETAHRRRYELFLQHIRSRFGLTDPPLCCVFVVVCLPRKFLVEFAQHATDDGFVEYRVPIYAQAFRTRFADASRFPVWIQEDPNARWYQQRARALNGFGREISLATMIVNLAECGGARIFHPVRRPLSAIAAAGPFTVALMAASATRGR